MFAAIPDRHRELKLPRSLRLPMKQAIVLKLQPSRQRSFFYPPMEYGHPSVGVKPKLVRRMREGIRQIRLILDDQRVLFVTDRRTGRLFVRRAGRLKSGGLDHIELAPPSLQRTAIAKSVRQTGRIRLNLFISDLRKDSGSRYAPQPRFPYSPTLFQLRYRNVRPGRSCGQTR